MKLWEKNTSTEQSVLDFTIGNDPDFDGLLAPYDVLASMAHAVMLGETGIIERNEARKLVDALAAYYPVVNQESFSLGAGEEDIHSHLENYLVAELGSTGKKIHTARSRNDQVLVALLLFMRDAWGELIEAALKLAETMLKQAEAYRDVPLPGYTHMQVAMPSSFGLWLGAYAESVLNDLLLTDGVLAAMDMNPLGSAAGYGSSFPIQRELTTELLGFSAPMISSVTAQLSRSKVELFSGYGLSALATTLSRFATDSILYMSQNFGFISFPEKLTTGSSIMPHKKNPDVLELIRAHCNRITTVPAALSALAGNLTSGYHRDFQLTKEIVLPAFSQMASCLHMAKMMVESMEVNRKILEDERYRYIYSVEEVNRKVQEGISFREAYRQVAEEIKNERYRPGRGASYTHLGSIGNPGLEQIAARAKKQSKHNKLPAAETIYQKLRTYFETQ